MTISDSPPPGAHSTGSVLHRAQRRGLIECPAGADVRTIARAMAEHASIAWSSGHRARAAGASCRTWT